MTPLPGESRGDARPRDRQDAQAHLRRTAPVRRYLAALLLAVLTVTVTATATVAGGGPAAAAGLSARTTVVPASLVGHPAGTRRSDGELSRSGVTAVPASPGGHAVGARRFDRDRFSWGVTAVPASPVGHPAGARRFDRDLVRSGAAAAPRAIPGPDPGPRTRAAAERLPPVPVTVPQPWAAAEHPRTPQYLPPPGPGAPLSRPPGLLPPLPGPASALAARPAAADRFRAALPGVRGPPGEAVHRPWDPSPVPSRTPAAAP
ncbi:hypothetical protein [Streptomyces sp. NPDC088726]|uniref:hypothetical protein n=1 Tax=Streptomyces sp. NPDC088726 TaxID=3365874 RepID=UPI0037F327C7